MKKLPNWNLEGIYPSVLSKEFSDTLEDIEKTSKNIVSELKEFKVTENEAFKVFLRGVIKEINKVIDEFQTLSCYCYCKVSVNTSDKDSVNALNKAENQGVWVNKVDLAFSKFLSSNQKMVKEVVKDKEFSDYKFVFDERIESCNYRMSDEMENLAYQMNLSGSQSWSRLQESLSSNASTDFRGEKKTVIELRALATSSDRELRKEAYEKELEIWDLHKTAFSYSLNGVKGTCLTLEKMRNWESPLKHSAFDARINMKVLDALISTLEKNLPIFTRYFNAKAKALGLKKLAFFDLFAPVGENTKRWEYEQTKDFIVKQYSLFNPAQGEFAKQAFENNWIDPEPRANKIGGAYDIYFPKVKQSRVFANYDYTYDSVSTLAHELGHAWHDRVVSNEDAIARQYPMTLAETASIFGEFVVFQGAVKEADSKEEMSLVESFLQGASQVCVDILCRFYFEREVFKRRQSGELMADEMSELMLECQKKTYGVGLDEKYLHKYMWAVKGHYYNEGFSFYNYPYAFGQLFGLGLYKKSQEDTSGTPFCDKFNKMLSLTGKQDAIDIASTVGCDITSEEFWQGGMDMINEYINLFVSLVDKDK